MPQPTGRRAGDVAAKESDAPRSASHLPKAVRAWLRRVPTQLVARVAVSWLLPAVAFVVLRSRLGGVSALAVAVALPAGKALVTLLVRRRLDAIALMSLVGFGVSLVVSVASGGNRLALELHGELWSTLAGLACVGSVLGGRPLLRIASRVVAQRSAHRGGDGNASSRERASVRLTLNTLLIGFVLLGDSLGHVLLAVNVSTVRYLEFSRLMTWGSLILVAFLARSALRSVGRGGPVA